MSTIYYEICGVVFQIESPQKLTENKEGKQFNTDKKESDVIINIDEKEYIAEKMSNLYGQVAETKIWRNDTMIIRQIQDRFRPMPHIEMKYDLKDLSNIKVTICKEYWVWASGTKYFWPGIGLHQLMLHFKTLFFHASYIDYQGHGILFTASSGTGKSTQAELWRKYRDAVVINGDKAAVSLRKFPTVHSIPFSGTSGICRNVSLPLEAIVVLSQAKENTIHKMRFIESVSALFSNIFVEKCISEEWNMAADLVMELAQRVNIYSLACTPDEQAVEVLEKELFK